MSTSFASPHASVFDPGESQGIRPAVDAEQLQQQWLSQFKSLKDPRGAQGKLHAFLSIVLIAILSTIRWSQRMGGHLVRCNVI